MHAGCDAPQVIQRTHQADGAVAAHAQVAAVVEEDHPGTGIRRLGFAQQGPHQHIAAPRLQHAGRAPAIVALLQDRQPFGHRTAAQIGKAVDNQASRLAPRM